MHQRVASWMVAGVTAMGSLVGGADAAVLSVDFNEDAGSVSPTQDGFSDANVGQNLSTPYTLDLDPYTVSIENDPAWGLPSNYTQSGSRSRDPLAAAGVSDLFRDFLFANNGHNRRFGLVVSGLEPDTTYDVTFWAYDHVASWNGVYDTEQTVTVTQRGVSAVTGDIAYTAGTGQPDSLDDNRVILTATTDSSGTLTFDITGTDNALLNGFEVNAIPEPGSIGLIAAGTGLIFTRRRR